MTSWDRFFCFTPVNKIKWEKLLTWIKKKVERLGKTKENLMWWVRVCQRRRWNAAQIDESLKTVSTSVFLLANVGSAGAAVSTDRCVRMNDIKRTVDRRLSSSMLSEKSNESNKKKDYKALLVFYPIYCSSVHNVEEKNGSLERERKRDK